MQPQIKSMQPEHVTQVAAIAAEVFSQPWSKESFLQALQQENACFLVACDKERVLGYCCMYMAADEGEIDNVAVIPQARRLGIGNLLLKELTDRGRAHGVTRFFLEVRVSNEAAIHLYHSNGFTEQGIRRNFYRQPTEDACIMNRIDKTDMK